MRILDAQGMPLGAYGALGSFWASCEVKADEKAHQDGSAECDPSRQADCKRDIYQI